MRVRADSLAPLSTTSKFKYTWLGCQLQVLLGWQSVNFCGLVIKTKLLRCTDEKTNNITCYIPNCTTRPLHWITYFSKLVDINKTMNNPSSLFGTLWGLLLFIRPIFTDHTQAATTKTKNNPNINTWQPWKHSGRWQYSLHSPYVLASFTANYFKLNYNYHHQIVLVTNYTNIVQFYYTPTTKCGGGAILDSLCRVGRSVRPSVRLQFLSAHS